MMRMKNGYTLTEVLMVVVIIGILSALVIPRFAAQPERANAAEAAGILGAIRQGEMSYHLDTGAYLSPADDTDWAKLGLDNPNGAKFTYTVDDEGTGTATRTGGGADFDTTTITLTIGGVWGGTHPHAPSN